VTCFISKTGSIDAVAWSVGLLRTPYDDNLFNMRPKLASSAEPSIKLINKKLFKRPKSMNLKFR